MQIESGLQLLARLKSIPSLEGINNHLFPDGGPHPKNVIEISGDTNCGKTYILTDLIAKCILPIQYGGKNCGAIFVNTDHHFEHFTLLSIMEKYIKKLNKALNKSEVQNIIMTALKQLFILDCYDTQQYNLTLLNLEQILSDNSHIGLVAIDSICSYYWCDRLVNGIISMNKYLHAGLLKLQTAIKEYNQVIVYTKPSNFCTFLNLESTASKEVAFGKINYSITLSKSLENIFSVNVVTTDQNSKSNFKILNSVIEYE